MQSLDHRGSSLTLLRLIRILTLLVYSHYLVQSCNYLVRQPVLVRRLVLEEARQVQVIVDHQIEAIEEADLER